MLLRSVLGSVAVVVSLFAVGCAASPTEEPTDGTSAAVSTGTGKQVTGDHAARLFQVLQKVAGKNLTSADASNISCVQSNNENVGEDEPEYKITTTSCSLDLASGGSKTVEDALPKAKALWDAIGAASDDLVDAAGSDVFEDLTSVSCASGSCTLTPNSDIGPVTVDGDKAARLLQALALVGGAGTTTATNVKCASKSNNVVGADEPLYKIAMQSCSMTTDKDVSVEDAEPVAYELFDALGNAGVKAENSSGNKLSTVASRLTCHSSATSATCTLKL